MEDLSLSPMQKSVVQQKIQKSDNVIYFDNTTIAGRHSTVSWSSDV